MIKQKYHNHGIISLIDLQVGSREVLKVDDMLYQNWVRLIKLAQNLIGDKLCTQVLEKHGDRVEGIIAKSEGVVDSFIKYNSQNDIYNMAVMLGYPECCVENYVKIANVVGDNTSIDKYFSNMYLTDKNTNLYSKHISVGGLSVHHPCTSNCNKTIEKSMLISRILEKLN